jgi:hypothetical protein
MKRSCPPPPPQKEPKWTDSVLKPLILFCDWRGLLIKAKNLPVEPEPSRRFNLLFTVEGSGIQGIKAYDSM